jgi:HEAT repeat protein
MKKKTQVIFAVLSAMLMLGLVGCSRTISDIAKWKASGNIEKLIGALEDAKPQIRKGAAEALGELRAEAAVDPLAALFSDPDSEVSLTAVEALVAIGNEAAAAHLINALKLDDPSARTVAATGLGTLKTAAAVEALVEALGDTEEDVNCAAAVALGLIGDEAASAPLAGKLKSSSAKLRVACARSLAGTRGKAAVTGLIGALDDDDSGVREAVVGSLISIGKPAAPAVLKAIRDNNATVRRGALAVLKAVDAIPAAGSDLIWYQLAAASVDGRKGLDMTLVGKLARMGDPAVDTLLEAAAHNVTDFREHAFRALETMGEPATAKAVEAAGNYAVSDASVWFNARSTWSGTPSWRIDLWSAVAALNPDFELDTAIAANLQTQGRSAFRIITSPDFKPTREYIPLLVGLLGDQTLPPPKQPDVDAFGIPVVKQSVDRFRGEANQQMAREKLIAAGSPAVFPLIAAINERNALIAGHAATALGEVGDSRAVGPLMAVLKRRLAAGEQLTDSPFYSALQKFDDPAAEPVLLRIRPNTDRAIRVFERQYAGVRAMSAESRDTTAHHTQPITFRLGYIDGGKVGEMQMTFMKNAGGDWIPTPALPADLPQP